MAIDFRHYHVHTTYSFQDGYGLPDQVLDRVEEIGHNAIGISDHGNIWAHVPFWMAAKKRDVKVVLGCEFYIVEDADLRERKYYHITVFAKNQEGLTNLHKLVTYSNFKGFYYKPRIDFKTLLKCSEGLIVLSGCMGAGALLNNLGNDKWVDWYLSTFKAKFGSDFYVEVSAQGDRVRNEVKQIISLADAYKIRVVTTSDSHWLKPEDHAAQDLKLCISMKNDYEDPGRMKFDDLYYMFDGEEAEERGIESYGGRYKEFYETTLEITDKCNIERVQSKQKTFPLPENKSEHDYFTEKIEEGIEFRDLKSKPNWEEYEKRIEYEVGLISEKGFINYFLVIADLVVWAKKWMLVGAARGSSAGSIVAYILQIVEIDPLPFSLMFERFIDITRIDPPDIDIDFPDEKRQMVVDYLVEKYGKEYTSLLGTAGTFKPKISIWDTRRVYNLPWKEAKELAGMILERSSGDSRAKFCLADAFTPGNEAYIEEAGRIVKRHPLFKQSAKLEGQIRQTGIHAAAVVVSEEPLDKMSGKVRGKNGEEILSIDKYGAEALGLLKIDILALKQLTVLENVLKSAEKESEWLYNIPLDDEKVFAEIFQANKLWGIFQFEGDACRVVNLQVKPDTFQNICEVSALARPGALHSGGTTRYISYRAWEKGFDNKAKKKPEYAHPLLKELASETYGIVIYQEQVLQILRELGKMSWQDAGDLRKAMSKSYGVEFFDRYKVRFLKGACENGIDEAAAITIWENVNTFGSWAFNKSHAVSYGMISYWCAYLKTHYADEFYVETLKKETDEEVIKKILREWTESGRQFVVFDSEHSRENFSIHNGIIYGGYQNIKGIGEKAAQKLVAGLPWNDAEQFRKAAGSKGLKALKSLDGLNPMKKDSSNQMDMFAEFEYSVDDFSDIEPEQDISEIAPWADLYPIGSKFDSLIKSKAVIVTTIKEIEESTSSIVLIVKITHLNLRSMRETTITQKRKGVIKDPHLDQFLDFKAEDDTDAMFFGISRYKYEKLGKQLLGDHGVGSIIMIRGNKIPGFRKITVKNLKVLYSAKQKEYYERS